MYLFHAVEYFIQNKTQPKISNLYSLNFYGTIHNGICFYPVFVFHRYQIKVWMINSISNEFLMYFSELKLISTHSFKAFR